jgi:hypothetical protein
MAISTSSGCRNFRVAVTPTFVFVLVLSLFGLFCIILTLTLDGLHLGRRALAVAGVSVSVSSLVMAGLVSILYPASFSAEGLYGRSFWGRRRFVRWQEIAVARSFRLLNLRWLRIYTTDYSRVIWLALFQSHEAEFRQEIQRLAPAGSPIFKHLQ